MFLRDTRGIVRPRRARNLFLHGLGNQRPEQHPCGGQRYVPVLALYKSHRLERREERLGIGIVRIERHAFERIEPTAGKPETARPVVFFDDTLEYGVRRRGAFDIRRIIRRRTAEKTVGNGPGIQPELEEVAALHEEEVLVLLAQGHTRNGIARKLVVSDNTVRAHVKSIYHKLRIHSKQELVNIVDARRAAH